MIDPNQAPTIFNIVTGEQEEYDTSTIDSQKLYEEVVRKNSPFLKDTPTSKDALDNDIRSLEERIVLRQQEKKFKELNDQSNLSSLRALGDLVLNIGSGAVSGIGNTAGFVVGNYPVAIPGGTILPDSVKKQFRDAEIDITTASGNIADYINSFKSQENKNQQELFAYKQAISKADRDSGDGSVLGNLKDIGSGIIDTLQNVYDTPSVAVDTIASGLGSLIPSVGAAKAGSTALSSLGNLIGASKSRSKDLGMLGGFLGHVIPEIADTTSGAISEVMNYPKEVLEKNDRYNSLIESGVSEDEARRVLAKEASNEAFNNQIVYALGISAINPKFEVNPFVGGIASAAKETAEEAAMEGTSTRSQNIAIQDVVDPTRDPLEGVGESAALGGIGGLGVSGTTTSLGALGRGISNATDITSDIIAGTNDSTLMSDGVDLETLVSNLPESPTSKAATYLKDAVSSIASSDIVKNINEKVKDFVSEDSKRTKNEIVSSAEGLDSLVQNTINTNTPETPLPESIVSIGLEEQSTQPVPDEFKETISDKAPLTKRVVEIVKEFSKKASNLDNLSPRASLYVEEQLGKLNSVYETLPENIKPIASKIINSPLFNKVKTKVENIDLNEIHSEATNISPETVAEALSVSKINPTNVNPEFTNKILNHTGDLNLTEEDKKFLKVAYDTSSIINNRVKAIDEIKADMPKNVDPEGQEDIPFTSSDTTRSLVLTGMEKSIKGDPKPSINQLVGAIVKAMKSDDKSYVSKDGISIPLEDLVTRLKYLTTHMVNKVGALKQSIDGNDANGKGPKVKFVSLGQGELLPADHPRAAIGVVVHKRNKNSVRLAREIYADAKATADIYNSLINTFPELDNNNSVRFIAPDLGLDAVQEPEQEQDREIVDNAEDTTTETTKEVKEASQDTEETIDNETKKEEQTTKQEPKEEKDSVTEQEPKEKEEVNKVASLKRFNEIFKPKEEKLPYTKNLSSLLSALEENGANSSYIGFISKIVNPLMSRINKKLNSAILSKKSPLSIVDMIKRGDTDKIFEYTKFKQTMLVDPDTGNYNEDLVSLATALVLDWLTYAHSPTIFNLRKHIEDPGLGDYEFKDGELEVLIKGISIRQTTENLAEKLIKLWGVSVNKDARMSDVRGITEGIVKEILYTLAEGGKYVSIGKAPFINSKGVNVGRDVLILTGIKDIQDSLGSSQQGMINELIFPEDRELYSIGEKIKGVPTRNNKTDLTKEAMEIIKKQQDTSHSVNTKLAGIVNILGLGRMSNLLGARDVSNFEEGHPARIAQEGKNLSIKNNFEDTQSLLNSYNSFVESNPDSDASIYFPYEAISTGRYMIKGIGGQSNKILRAVVTPTNSEMDLSNKNHVEGFWFTVAQSSELGSKFKVGKASHEFILSNIEKAFNDRFGEAVGLAEDYLESGELDADAFVEALQGPNKETLEMVQINAVLAVAQYNKAIRDGETTVNIQLAFELDGLTDGPGNLLVNFGTGRFTELELENYRRVGYFVGETNKTTNDYYTVKDNKDLYGIIGNTAQEGGIDNEAILPQLRFFQVFGKLDLDDEGNIIIGRDAVKNPTTQSGYGAGSASIAKKLIYEAVIDFYLRASKAPKGADLATYFGYPDLFTDVENIFGTKITNYMDWRKVAFDKKAINKAVFLLSYKDFGGLAYLISESVKNVFGEKVESIRKKVIKVSQFQAEVISYVFDKKLKELAEKRANEGKIGRNKAGKALIKNLSVTDYNSVVADIEKITILYSNGVVNLGLGSVEDKESNFSFSSTIGEKFSMDSSLPMPSDDVGVSALPYITIGYGDANMINNLYMENTAPNDIFQIYDGVEVPFTKIKEYSQLVNGAVLKNWDNNVLKDVLNDFESFIKNVGVDTIKDFLTETESSFNLEEELKFLQEASKLSQIRKDTIKELPRSIDHMSGSNTSVSFNPNNMDDMSLEEINNKIIEKYNGKTKETNKVDTYGETAVISINATIERLLSGEYRDVILAIKKKLPKGMKIVGGSQENITALREKNYGDTTEFSTMGAYDINNNIVFLVSKADETLVHELIHAATFDKVLDHYSGNTNEAVDRLEGLMDEFLELDFSLSSLEVQDAVNSAKSQILGFLSKNPTPFNKAAALNEFMSWTLSNQKIASSLKTTRSGAFAKLTKALKHLMAKLLGTVRRDIYSQVVFNTKALDTPSTQEILKEIEELSSNTDDGGGNNNNDNDDNGGGNNNNNNSGDDNITPTSEKFSNFWIDLINKKLDKANAAKDRVEEVRKLEEYVNNAKDVLNNLAYGGFVLTKEQEQIFKAIHVVLASEFILDARASVAVQQVFNHVLDKLTPEMFTNSKTQQEDYLALMTALGTKKNREGVSDTLAVFLALSQTSAKFREALDNIPEPKKENANEGTLNEALEKFTGLILSVAIGGVDINNVKAKGVLDTLAKQLIVIEKDSEFTGLRTIMLGLNKADSYFSGLLSKGSKLAGELGTKAENTFAPIKFAAKSVSLATAMFDKDRGAQVADWAKTDFAKSSVSEYFVFIREAISEIIGTDKTNTDLVALLDLKNSATVAVRQGFVERVPIVLQESFSKAPTASEWTTLYTSLGSTDFSVLFNSKRPNASMQIFKNEEELFNQISNVEVEINNNFEGSLGKEVIEKSKQLAKFMLGKGAGKLLQRNAYAIAKLTGNKTDKASIDLIDKLVSLYAVSELSPEQRETIVDLYTREPEGMRGLLTYLKFMNYGEDNKVISEEARLNGYKGFIPNRNADNTSIIILNDSSEEVSDYLRLGYRRVGDYVGLDKLSSNKLGYYFSNTKQGGNYLQGVMQTINSTYRGVNADTGMSVSSLVYSGIGGDSANVITKKLNKGLNPVNDKETILPVFDEEGNIVYYEFAINPDIHDTLMNPVSNLALMLGVWAGRNVEEGLAQEYNNALVDMLKNIYKNRKTGTDNLYINIADPELKDPIYKDSWSKIPIATKEYIESIFGKEFFPIDKNMINLAVGYSETSVMDIYTGKTRLNKPTAEFVKAVTKLVFKDNAAPLLAKGESLLQEGVSLSKNLIVVRSMIIPISNCISNMHQLQLAGVGTRDILVGVRDKLAEIEEYTKNISKIMNLTVKRDLNSRNQSEVTKIDNKIKAIEDQNARMSIAPVIKAGAFKNISEGLTDIDSEDLSKGMVSWLDTQYSKLPATAKKLVDYGLINKNTGLYKAADKSVQYGDFIAKSILYGHLVKRKGMGTKEALAIINEEFINFSVPPGRVRSALESYGMTWFYTYKLRAMKTGLKYVRDNPLRFMISINDPIDIGTPITDNLASIIEKGTLDYSTGFGMLFSSLELNPWYSIVD